MVASHSIKIADAGERTSAFRRARLNSVMVRLLRWVLPVGAVMLLGSYALFMQRTIKVETANHSGTLNTGTVSTSLDNMSMMNPSYEGYNKKDGSRYKVSAKRAITDLSRDKPIELQEIEGTFQQGNGQKTAISAKQGSFDQTAATLSLDGGIEVEAPNDLSVSLTSAKIDTKTSEITSAEPVLVRMPAGEVRANTMRLDQRAHEIIFGNGVAASLSPPQRPPQKPTETPAGQQDASSTAVSVSASPRAALTSDDAGAVLGFGGNSNAPVTITSTSLTIAEKQRTAQFMGSVRAIQNASVLETPSLTASFEGTATGNSGQPSQGITDGALAAGGRLRKITARNGVRMSQAGNEVVARTADFDVVSNQAELSGEVRISAPSGQSIDAEHAAIDMATNNVVLTGGVVARQNESLLRGNRMQYEPKQGRMRLSSPAGAGVPHGDIFVRFRSEAANGRGAARRQPTVPGADFSTDPDAPIEIVARSMDVQDAKSVARFDGNVRAKQGDLTLTTPILTAHYDGQLGLFSNPQASAGVGGSPRPAMKMRFIRATNPVAVSSGSDMKANGENAEFDMAANTVTISGNVVLQRGRQIIRGDRLVIDLKTGLSRMKNAAPENKTVQPLTFGAPPQITANPGRRDCGGQMCAVFFPQDLQQEQAARKPSAQASPARNQRRQAPPRKPKLDSGWSTSTNVN